MMWLRLGAEIIKWELWGRRSVRYSLILTLYQSHFDYMEDRSVLTWPKQGTHTHTHDS